MSTSEDRTSSVDLGVGVAICLLTTCSQFPGKYIFVNIAR